MVEEREKMVAVNGGTPWMVVASWVNLPPKACISLMEKR
jgi:hypothetical protein